MKQSRGLNLDFWKFWTGQTISNFGSSISDFAIPLLVFKLTGSALNLAIAGAATMLPYLLFGLLIGAWVDRVDRKRLMIGTDVLRAAVIASIPLAFALGILSVWWIYAVGFINSTLSIFFNSSEFAAIPSLVESDDLVTANGRIQASYSAASFAGPFLAGVAIVFLPLTALFLADASSFLVSAVSLVLVSRSFNEADAPARSSSVLGDVVEGLRYVLGHPVLRMISAMMALVNFVSAGAYAEMVLFAKDRLAATDSEVGWLFSAGSIGITVLSLSAGLLRKRFKFSQVALGALILNGLLLIVFSQLRIYWVGLITWGLFTGTGILFNINTGSLRQAIVPNHLLGRVISIASVLAWSAIPLGALLAGYAIQLTGNIALVYLVSGFLTVAIPVAFAFTALGRAERYLPAPKAPEAAAEPV